jgi:hypothetical protein
MDETTPAAQRFAVCIRNDGYPVALELHQSYAVIPDDTGERYGLVRVVDETGDSALYPRECFRIDP